VEADRHQHCGGQNISRLITTSSPGHDRRPSRWHHRPIFALTCQLEELGRPQSASQSSETLPVSGGSARHRRPTAYSATPTHGSHCRPLIASILAGTALCRATKHEAGYCATWSEEGRLQTAPTSTTCWFYFTLLEPNKPRAWRSSCPQLSPWVITTDRGRHDGRAFC
jgi:hypothetical protein